MPRNVYCEINLHLNWHTKEDTPVLVDAVENRTHYYLKHRALQSPGVIVHAINGTADHVHLVVSVPTTLLISEWIGRLKDHACRRLFSACVTSPVHLFFFSSFFSFFSLRFSSGVRWAVF